MQARDDPYVAVDVHPPERRVEPLATGLGGDVVHRDPLSSVLLCGPTGEVDFDGLHNLSATEGHLGRTANQQYLVDIVMKDLPEALSIKTTEAYADTLGDPVTDGIRMAEPFALDDFDLLRSGRRRLTRADNQFQQALRPDSPATFRSHSWLGRGRRHRRTWPLPIK